MPLRLGSGGPPELPSADRTEARRTRCAQDATIRQRFPAAIAAVSPCDQPARPLSRFFRGAVRAAFRPPRSETTARPIPGRLRVVATVLFPTPRAVCPAARGAGCRRSAEAIPRSFPRSGPPAQRQLPRRRSGAGPDAAAVAGRGSPARREAAPACLRLDWERCRSRPSDRPARRRSPPRLLRPARRSWAVPPPLGRSTASRRRTP